MTAVKARIRRNRHLQAAEGYLTLQLPDHALDELRTVQSDAETATAVNLLRGEAFRQKGEYRAALRFFRRVLRENPRDVAVLMGMAWCYKRTGRLRRAIRAMRQANRVDPDQPVVLYNLACYYALAGEKPQALSWLGRALRKEGALRKLIPAERDFDGLRDDPDFEFVTRRHDEI